jgi:hypothetical protein
MVGKNYQSRAGVFRDFSTAALDVNYRTKRIIYECSLFHVSTGEIMLSFNAARNCIIAVAGYSFIDGGCPVVSSTRIQTLPSGSTFDPEVTM